MDLLIFLMLPLLQVGFTFWLSFQTLQCGLVLAKIRHVLFPAIAQNFSIKATVVLCMFFPVVFGNSSDILHDFLMHAREALIFLLVISILKYLSGKTLDRNVRQAGMIALCVTAGITLLLAIQMIAIPLGIYVGLPKSYFITNNVSLGDSVSVLLSAVRGDRLRPTGTFGEPSYCSFVLISLFVMYHKYLRSPDRYMKQISTGICVLVLLGGLITSSASFIVSAILLSYFAFFRQFKLRKLIVPTLLLLSLVIGVAQFGALKDVSRRIAIVSAADVDISTASRIVAPAITIGPYLWAHPIGAPFSRQDDALGPYAARFGLKGLDLSPNGLFNLIFVYGILGLPMLWLILRGGSDATFKLYLLLAMAQNGAFLAVDKFTVVTLAAFYYESSKRRTASGAITSVRSARKPPIPVSEVAPQASG